MNGVEEFGQIVLAHFLGTNTGSRLRGKVCRVAVRGILAFFQGARITPEMPEGCSRPCYEEGRKLVGSHGTQSNRSL